MEIKKVTATKGRLSEGLNKLTSDTIDKTVPLQIEEAIDKVRIKTGVITRFYPYIDKAEVKLDLSNEKVLCKILHRYGGDLIDFYTPLADRTDYDDKRHESYVVPKASQNVCILNIRDIDSEENLILGYYHNRDIVGFNPAKPGNIKIMNVTEDYNEFWIKFGVDGFNYKVRKSPNRQIGDVHTEEGVKEVNYSNSDEVYTKEEIDELIRNMEGTSSYTKQEIDDKFQVYENRIKELEDVLRENNLLED